MSNQTHYDILGVPNDADESQIKKAYRALSLKYHPDRNPSEEAKSKIQEINGAYEVLSNDQSRAQYDNELRFGNGGGGIPFTHMNSMNEFTDINNIFNMMFGGGFPGGMQGMPEIRVFHGGSPGGFNMHAQMFHNMHQRPEPVQCNVELTLEQSYEGCVYPLTIERWLINNNVRSTEKETININIPPGLDNNDTIIYTLRIY